MATSAEARKRLTIVTEERGADQAAAKLRGLAGAQDDVAITGQRTERATLQMAAAIDRKIARLDPLVRAERQYAQALKDNARFEADAAGTASTRARLLELETQKYLAQVAAIERVSAARKASVQASVDRQTITPDRAADIAAYGEELDRLRAKYNPLWAAGQQYKATLDEINMASKVGAITEIERATAIDRTKLAFVGEVAAINAATNATNANNAAVKLNTFQVQNLGFQMNDIATMLASGQSPFVLLMQQGMQIAQIFGPGVGVSAALKATGAALMSFLLNPLTLAVAGFAAAAGAASLLFNAVGSGASRTERALEKHKELVDRIGALYRNATANAVSYQRAASLVLQFETQNNVDTLRGQLGQDARAFGRDALSTVSSGVRRAIDLFRDPAGLQQIDALMRRFNQTVAAGAPDVSMITVGLAEIGQQHPDLRVVVTDLLAMASGMTKTADAIAEGEKNLRSFLGLGGELGIIVDEFGRIDMRLPAAQRAAARDMGQLGAYQNEQGVTLRRMQQSADASILGITARSPSEKAAAAAAAAAAQYNADEHPDVRNARIATDATLARVEAEHALAEAQRDRLRSLQETIRSSEIDLALVGKGVEATAALRMEYQLTAALREEAAKNGIAADEKEIALIRQKSAEYGRLQEQMQEVAKLQELSFERSQMFRSPTEQAVASGLRDLYGDQWQKHADGAVAIQIRLNEALRTGADIAHDFASGFVSDLQNGASVVDALGNALNRLQSRLLDMAMDQAINGLFNSLAGILGGSMGGGVANTTGYAINPWSANGIFGVRSAMGNVFERGQHLTAFARGDIIDRPTIFPMRNGAGLMGEAGPEAVMPLRRTSDGRLGVAATGGAALNVSVRILDRTGDGVSVQEGERRRTPGGGVEIDLIVDKMVAGKMSNRGSATNKALRTMGVSGQLTMR